MAIAPTATIANIAGCIPSIEPIYKNIYVKSNFSGEFTIINRHLVGELQVLGLWNEDMIERLKFYDGSVQSIPEIPDGLRAKYKEVFEIEPYWVVRHAAHRAKWIDQSQSVNLFTTSTSGKHISEIYMNAWKMGLKTTYYLRTMGASSIEKATLDQKSRKFLEHTRTTAVIDKAVPATRVANACSIDDPTCEACQ
jgi:ribonucleoside-diphosphate reductase alpha chain